MRVIFAGTPDFAATILDGLIDAGFDIAMVLTQPDRAAGRGMQLRASSVKGRAQAHHLKVLQPENLKTAEIQYELRAACAEAMVVAAYGLILPAAVLQIPVRGCINVHASLLPRWRGAAPIQRALLAGDSETGVTIMQMDAGLDTGAILLQESVPITSDDTAQTVHDKLERTGARCIVQVLNQAPDPRPQDGSHATYAEKISKAEARIDWTNPAEVISRQVRAYNPMPGATTTFCEKTLKIWRAYPAGKSSGGATGSVITGGGEIVITTGNGALVLTELQAAGGKRLTATEFLAGHPMPPGTRLGI